MKMVSTKLPENLAAKLRDLAQRLDLPQEELIARSLSAYLRQLGQSEELQDIGFGMWAQRPDLKNSRAWTRRLRASEWHRSLL